MASYTATYHKTSEVTITGELTPAQQRTVATKRRQGDGALLAYLCTRGIPHTITTREVWASTA